MTDQAAAIMAGIPAARLEPDAIGVDDPAARVVYADNDPIVVAHARALLTDAPQVAAVEAAGTARTRDQIGRMLDGLELVPPGLTGVAAWRPRRRVTAGRPVLFRAGTGHTPGTTP